MAIKPPLLLLLLSLIATSASLSSAHNITEMLSAFPDYSLYNSYLTQTKLCDEINTRQTLTVFVLNNAAMSALAKHPLSVVKNVLSLLIVLDYFDNQKLHSITDGSMLSTTLYQTTGDAKGNFGFVNITDLKGGKVGFGSAAPGSPLDSTYTKSVKQVPYNISVMEISAPIIAPGLLSAPAPSVSQVNLTATLEKAGCKIFASLLASSGVLKNYQDAMDKGLTILAPNDEAFKKPEVPDTAGMRVAQLVSLLEYHALPSYSPPGALKAATGPVSTLASGVRKFAFRVATSGDEVTLDTGVDKSRIASTVLDDAPLCILTVDNVLLPEELFPHAPASAPSPVPVSAPAPSPVAEAPSPVAEVPAPAAASPPAPTAAGSEASPSEAPAESADSKGASSGDKARPLCTAAALVFGSFACFLLLLL
ncbi:fasciclin-like arabinogalactan protein 8 [Amborella trichopoda]|uniref:FAS1 domain-containing protein n=1 Tax=Amborella trichopoda TaxID=13333 RepID=U5DGC3_AMBTC|nr:fasciclin-like arabinogalactan protein 8 [Amborella trichopoda]ERN19483.1 hypothetical protein AMTR_s00069p00195790 [Amborella trichopoda]|eukprot:XP_006858016.1 fasciclin-like arabinogalactan protein 8 [Amborella trichopoda]